MSKRAVMFLLYFLSGAVWNSGVTACVCFVWLRGGEYVFLFFAQVVKEL